MPAPRKYSDELRERAIRTVNEMLRENAGMPVTRACNQVGEQLGISGATLRNWVCGPSPAAGSSSTGTDPHERLVQLEKENRELSGERDPAVGRGHVQSVVASARPVRAWALDLAVGLGRPASS